MQGIDPEKELVLQEKKEEQDRGTGEILKQKRCPERKGTDPVKVTYSMVLTALIIKLFLSVTLTLAMTLSGKPFVEQKLAQNSCSAVVMVILKK